MAGDWIKMRADLLTHPKVVRMMSALKADRLRIIGGLHAVWCLFDVHSIDGYLDGYTPEVLDQHLGWDGFSDAMILIGWLESDGKSLQTPRFDEHNGQSAKRRAQETTRKRDARKVSAPEADKKRTREEKRREDIKPNPLKPPRTSSLDAGFDAFWLAYPKKTGKEAARKSWAKLKPHLDAVLKALAWQVNSEQWLKDSGQFIPNPATYLNQGRWQDEQQAVISSGASGKPWFITSTGIEAKAKELNLEKTRDEVAFQFYERVCRQAGITPDMLRKANIDHGIAV